MTRSPHDKWRLQTLDSSKIETQYAFRTLARIQQDWPYRTAKTIADKQKVLSEWSEIDDPDKSREDILSTLEINEDTTYVIRNPDFNSNYQNILAIAKYPVIINIDSVMVLKYAEEFNRVLVRRDWIKSIAKEDDVGDYGRIYKNIIVDEKFIIYVKTNTYANLPSPNGTPLSAYGTSPTIGQTIYLMECNPKKAKSMLKTRATLAKKAKRNGEIPMKILKPFRDSLKAECKHQRHGKPWNWVRHNAREKSLYEIVICTGIIKVLRGEKGLREVRRNKWYRDGLGKFMPYLDGLASDSDRDRKTFSKWLVDEYEATFQKSISSSLSGDTENGNGNGIISIRVLDLE